MTEPLLQLRVKQLALAYRKNPNPVALSCYRKAFEKLERYRWLNNIY